MKNIIWSLFALLILTGTSCQESVDIEAEKQLIKDKSTAIIEAEQQKDLNAALSYYAEDVILQVSNTPQTQGLEALRNFLEGFFKVMVSIEGGLTEVTVSEAADSAPALHERPFRRPPQRAGARSHRPLQKTG